MSDPTALPVNSPIEITDNVIHSLIFEVAVNAALADIIATLPILGVPGVKQILGLIVNYIAGKIYDVLSTTAAFAIIDAQTGKEADAVNASIWNLKNALLTGKEDQIEKSKSDFRISFAALIHTDGSAPR